MMLDRQNNQTDVVVVGGGLAGLTAACYLSRAGRAVTLLEKASAVGGRARTHIHDGFAFNLGIHALYCGGAGVAVLKELGISYSGGSPRQSFVLHQGHLSLAPAGPRTLLTTDLLRIGEKLALLRLLLSLPTVNPTELKQTSVQEWLEQNIRQPRVRAFVAALARTFVYSSALDLVSAELFVRKLQTISRHPVLYLDGGWLSLVDSLCVAIEQAGARILTGASVEAVVHADGRVRGVRLRDGTLIHARTVVLAVTPQQAAQLVDENAFPNLRKTVGRLIPVQIACLDVALQRLPVPRYSVVQDMDHPRFMSAQSLYACVAPETGVLIHTFKQLDPAHPVEPHEDERDLEALLEAVQPGWRKVVVRRVYLPRIAAVGALPTAASGGLSGRPGPDAAGLPGLHLAGDWIGPEGFLSDASFASARAVAQRILLTETSTSLSSREPRGGAVGSQLPVESEPGLFQHH